jgi:hypothetical protein
VNTFLDLSQRLQEELWTHLLQNNLEQVSFVFASVEVVSDSTVFTAQEHYLAVPDDFSIHSECHVELTDDARAKTIKRAWDTGTTPVELHSHPGDHWGAMFSPSDMHGFADFVPHCRWRLRGRPYLAIVVTPYAADALAWVEGRNDPSGLAAIRVTGGHAIFPTRRTIDYIEACKREEQRHGPRAF